MKTIPAWLSGQQTALKEEILAGVEVVDIPADTEILREGQFVKVIPIVLSGLIKVFSRYDDKELLLYYVKADESCIMSFSAGISHQPSRVFALTEEDSEVMLLPVSKLGDWLKRFPALNDLFFAQYNMRYIEMLDAMNHVLFDKMDKRVLNYLIEKVELTGKNPLRISHRQIASELGTAREVVSRIVKKLEHEGRLQQGSSSIELLEL